MELMSVVFSSALVFLAVLVQHFNNVYRKGTRYVLSSRSESPGTDGFTGRATRTLQNNLESCAMYAPVALAVVVLHKQSTLSFYAALFYVLARVVFAFCYWFNISGVRSTAWLIGMISVGTMMAVVLL
ncbi:MAG: hypothetical protein EKK33_02025 [Bradyrhizobiaceae bacterium]|nr:MAG: hypothetical protein EKK33_02025 [Bradyrhizobiaceae bacterium]